MALVVTPEIVKFREKINEKVKTIENLMIRLEDEYEYEGSKPYKEALIKLFSDLGETTVKSNGRRFIITTKLNNFQKSEIRVGTASIKWMFLQAKQH